jgi:hypothetical protein
MSASERFEEGWMPPSLFLVSPLPLLDFQPLDRLLSQPCLSKRSDGTNVFILAPIFPTPKQKAFFPWLVSRLLEK